MLHRKRWHPPHQMRDPQMWQTQLDIRQHKGTSNSSFRQLNLPRNQIWEVTGVKSLDQNPAAMTPLKPKYPKHIISNFPKAKAQPPVPPDLCHESFTFPPFLVYPEMVIQTMWPLTDLWIDPGLLSWTHHCKKASQGTESNQQTKIHLKPYIMICSHSLPIRNVSNCDNVYDSSTEMPYWYFFQHCPPSYLKVSPMWKNLLNSNSQSLPCNW